MPVFRCFDISFPSWVREPEIVQLNLSPVGSIVREYRLIGLEGIDLIQELGHMPKKVHLKGLLNVLLAAGIAKFQFQQCGDVGMGSIPANGCIFASQSLNLFFEGLGVQFSRRILAEKGLQFSFVGLVSQISDW